MESRRADGAIHEDPTGSPRLRFLQWTVQGLRLKKQQLLQDIFEEDLVVVLLQKTLTCADFEWQVAGYTLHSLSAIEGTRVCAALMRRAVPHR